MNDGITEIADFRRKLGDWYTANRRPLPWRTEPSLYRTVVSELMAQQTRIATMLPYFERWMVRFPDFQALASAPEADVLKHWEGLGYYSRARNLHKLSKSYIALETTPVTPEEWQALPGIGPYTAAAISSIAQNYPAAVVDGNVVRVLSRLENNRSSFKSNAEAVKAFTASASEALDPLNPGDHNQAMMELGASLCLKQKPLCTVCPVLQHCRAAASGDPSDLPKIARKATEKVEVDRLWILDQDKVLLRFIPKTAKQLAGQYELPRPKDLAIQCPKGRPIITRIRAITNRRIRESIYQYTVSKEKLPDSLRWVYLRDITNITLSGPHRRWIQELLQ
ncbi:MAG: A/G-specific adenine glycosylase [Coraliomargaritaceae bacterium]